LNKLEERPCRLDKESDTVRNLLGVKVGMVLRAFKMVKHYAVYEEADGGRLLDREVYKSGM